MRAGWEEKPVSEIADHSLGKMLDKSKNRGEPREYLRNVNVRWFGFDLSDLLKMRFLPEEEARYSIVRGDLVVCEGGYPGRAAIWESDEPIYFQKALHRLRFHEPERNSWVLYYLQYLDLMGELQKHFSGTGIQHFTKRALSKLPVPVPPLEEQRRIVGVLDRAFEAIAAAKANAQRNLENTGQIFETALGLSFSDLWGQYPARPLSDLTLSITDGDHQPPPKAATGVPFITIRNIVKQTRTIDFRDTFKVPRSYYSALKENRRPQKGDILYTVTGSYGIPVIVREDREFCFQRHIGMVRPKPEVESSWLYYLLLSPQIRALADASATGTAQKTVSLKSLRSFRVPLPPNARQAEIAAELDVLQGKVRNLERLCSDKLTALDELKKSLLHQAFTGRL